jgi:hypothetical protein
VCCKQGQDTGQFRSGHRRVSRVALGLRFHWRTTDVYRWPGARSAGLREQSPCGALCPKPTGLCSLGWGPSPSASGADGASIVTGSFSQTSSATVTIAVSRKRGSPAHGRETEPVDFPATCILHLHPKATSFGFNEQLSPKRSAGVGVLRCPPRLSWGVVEGRARRHPEPVEGASACWSGIRVGALICVQHLLVDTPALWYDTT